MEIWKQIKEYEDLYEISNAGQVKNLLTGKLLKQGLRGWKNQYKSVTLQGVNRRIAYSVHRLVALCFCENPNNKPEVNHIDTNTFNNYHTNLEWVTRKENAEHAAKLGLYPRGIKHCWAKLSPEVIKEIRQYRLQGESQNSIAKRFGVNQVTIFKILHGQTWKHVA